MKCKKITKPLISQIGGKKQVHSASPLQQTYMNTPIPFTRSEREFIGQKQS